MRTQDICRSSDRFPALTFHWLLQALVQLLGYWKATPVLNFIPHEGQGDPYMLVEEEDTCINQEMTQSLRRAEGRTRRHPFWQSCLLHFLLVVVMQGGGLLGAQEMHNYSLPTAYGGPRASEYSPRHARRRVAYNTIQRNLSIKDTLN